MAITYETELQAKEADIEKLQGEVATINEALSAEMAEHSKVKQELNHLKADHAKDMANATALRDMAVGKARMEGMLDALQGRSLSSSVAPSTSPGNQTNSGLLQLG